MSDPPRRCADADELAVRFPRLSDACRDLAERRVFATRVDVAVSVDGVSYGAAFGDGADDCGPDPMYELHCLTKPIVAWALLEVASRHGLDPLEPLRTALGPSFPFDDAVTVAGICNHTTRLALPSGLDWVANAPARRPTVADLCQEDGGSWYSEVGSWVVADAVIAALELRPAADVVAALVDRGAADAVIGSPIPSQRSIVPSLIGLPEDPVPMLHVVHPTYQARLGPAFGGFGSVMGYVRFLHEVGSCLRGERTTLDVDAEVIQAIAAGRPSEFDRTWRRPAGFCFAMVDGSSPGEVGDPACLSMFAGVASTACLVDRLRDRQVVFASNGASFDAQDHRFVRGQVLGAFFSDTGEPTSGCR